MSVTGDRMGLLIRDHVYTIPIILQLNLFFLVKFLFANLFYVEKEDELGLQGTGHLIFILLSF